MNSRGQGLEHTMDVEKFNKLGEEAQGLLTVRVLTIRGAYAEDRVRFTQRCREGKRQWLGG